MLSQQQQQCSCTLLDITMFKIDFWGFFVFKKRELMLLSASQKYIVPLKARHRRLTNGAKNVPG